MANQDEQTIQRALRALHSANAYDRHAALETLARLRVTDAVEQVMHLVSDPDFSVREIAVWALGDLGSPAATDILLDIADGRTQTTEMRAAAIHSLGMIGDLSALPTLFQLSYDDPEQELRESAVRAILRYGDNAVLSMVQTLNERQLELTSTRIAATALLGKLKAVRAIPDLMNASLDDDPPTRWEAVKALGEIADRSTEMFLIGLLRHSDPYLNTITVWALEMLETPESLRETQEWRKQHSYTAYDGVTEPMLPPPRPDDLDLI